MIVWLILSLVVVYCFLIFVASRFVVPFMGFKQFVVPTILPEEIKNTITDLENKSTDQQAYLQAVYNLVLDKTIHQWKHTRFQAATRFPRAFVKDLSEIWQTKDFIYCTGINYVIFVLLTGSKYFKADDIKAKYTFVNFFIHQYLRVKTQAGWIDVDPAGTGIRGRPLGAHLSLFG